MEINWTHSGSTLVKAELWIGAKLSIGVSPSDYQLQVAGACKLTSFIESTKFQIGSDKRLKDNVQQASLDECTRLVLEVRPVVYNLITAPDVPELGYLANDFEREARDGFRCVLGESEAVDGVKFLALDYSRIVPILHGSLLDLMSKFNAALARIEALENRLT